MQYSPNYHFNLPQPADFSDISDLTENWSDADEIIQKAVEKEFLDLYKMCNETLSIREVSGNTVVTKTDSTNSVTSVTTIEDLSDTETRFTTVVTPEAGDYKYTKIYTMTDSIAGTDGAGTYSKSLKN